MRISKIVKTVAVKMTGYITRGKNSTTFFSASLFNGSGHLVERTCISKSKFSPLGVYLILEWLSSRQQTGEATMQNF